MSEQSDTAVDHPSHYNQGQIETIQVIEDAGLGQGFCLGNALKYLLRAPHKGSYLQDLKKARWYIDRMIQKEDPAEASDRLIAAAIVKAVRQLKEAGRIEWKGVVPIMAEDPDWEEFMDAVAALRTKGGG